MTEELTSLYRTVILDLCDAAPEMGCTPSVIMGGLKARFFPGTTRGEVDQQLAVMVSHRELRKDTEGINANVPSYFVDDLGRGILTKARKAGII